MSASYYDSMRQLALQKRSEYGLQTSAITLSSIRDLYKGEGITIDLRKLSPRIRGVYMCDDNDPSVLINKNLPEEPRIFTMIHELKHHFVDRAGMASGVLQCGDYNLNQTIEIGAEIFAAEFIFPETEFLAVTEAAGITKTNCSPEKIVELKRACNAKVSYTFLQKRLERLGYIARGQFSSVKFKNLEETIYGLPVWKQPWFRARRAAR